jgi:serine/threonine-protein kinase RsbT
MPATRHEVRQVRASEDVVVLRQLVRQWAVEMSFSLIDQTKLVTAASELARNTVEYGRGGTATIEQLAENGRQAIRITFEDNGPGIPDIELALRDGYTTGKGLGLGLSGARRLVNHFEIDSRVNEGTRVTIVKWV